MLETDFYLGSFKKINIFFPTWPIRQPSVHHLFILWIVQINWNYSFPDFFSQSPLYQICGFTVFVYRSVVGARERWHVKDLKIFGVC